MIAPPASPGCGCSVELAVQALPERLVNAATSCSRKKENVRKPKKIP
jgi:hypothetical protein